MAALETFVLRTVVELEAFASEWEGLLAGTATPELFASWPWISAWWDVFGGDGTRRPLLIGVRQGKTLVGFAPFVVHEKTGLPLAPVRRLELMGTGEDEADEVCSDFLDVLAAPGYEDMVASAVWHRLMAERPTWDEALFRNVLDRSLLARFVGPMARDAGCGVHRRPSGDRFWVDLGASSFDAYTDGLSKKRKKRIFYYRRRLEKEGGFGEARITRREDIPMFLAEIARLSCLRLGQRGKASAWSSERFRRFHALVAPRLWDRGQLDLRLWRRDGRAVAALYNFVYAGTIYYYQSGFDTAAFGNVSPGLVTLSHVIEWGFGQKLARFDFLVGAEGSYKEDYGCATAPAFDLTFFNVTARGQLLRTVRGLKDAFAQVRRRLREVQTPGATPGTGAAVVGNDDGSGSDEIDLRSV